MGLRGGFWRNKNVFVTGATGLVGSWLTKFLMDDGANVVGLVRDRVPNSILWRSSGEFDYVKNALNVVNGCVEDYQLLERAMNEYEVEAVFHLAAQTIVGIANRNPLSTFESNVRGTYNLLEAARRNKRMLRAVVVASSDKAYGEQEKLPYDEESPMQGAHPYDVSKSCADLMTTSYFRTYGLPAVVTRCGNLFGPGDLNFNRIVPQTIRHALGAERPVIRSDGGYLRDYFYVKDGALALKFVAEQMYERDIGGKAFNFSNGKPMTVVALVERILRIMGREDLEPVILNEAEGEIKNQYLSPAKAETLGWRARYPLDDALAETIGWYKELMAAGRER